MSPRPTAAHIMPMRDFAKSLPMALLRAREAVMNEFRPNLLAHGLNEQQWRVLRALSSAKEPLAVGELAQKTLLLGPSLSRILARLEEREWINRRVDGLDGRRSFISITSTGVDLVRALAPHSEQTYGSIEDRFGRQRLSRLLSELNALSEQEERWQAQAEAAQ